MGSKTKYYRFTVEGSGDFPFDMLRYDTCWPASEDSHGTFGLTQTAARRINLCGIAPPTVLRWKSFGWNVVASSEIP